MIQADKIESMITESRKSLHNAKQEELKADAERTIKEISSLLYECINRNTDQDLLAELNLELSSGYDIVPDLENEDTFLLKNLIIYLQFEDEYRIYLHRHSSYEVHCKLYKGESPILGNVKLNTCWSVEQNQVNFLELIQQREQKFAAYIQAQVEEVALKERQKLIGAATKKAAKICQQRHQQLSEQLATEIQAIEQVINKHQESLAIESEEYLTQIQKGYQHEYLPEPITLYKWTWQLSLRDSETGEVDYLELYGLTDHYQPDRYVKLIDGNKTVTKKPPEGYPINVERIHVTSFAELPSCLTKKTYKRTAVIVTPKYTVSQESDPCIRIELPSLAKKVDPADELVVQVDGLCFQCNEVKPSIAINEERNTFYYVPQDTDTSKYDSDLYCRSWTRTSHTFEISQAVKPILEHWQHEI